MEIINFILNLPIEIFIIFILLFFSAFFSGSETSLTAVSQATIVGMSNQGDKKAKLISKLISDKESLIGAILFGNNCINILASSLATAMALRYFEGNAVSIATLVMTLLVLIFAEILPKTLAISRPIHFSKFVATPMYICKILLAPITKIIQIFVRSMLLIFNIRLDKTVNVLSAAEELRHTIDLHHDEGRVEKEDRNLIRGALELDTTSLEEIMIHRKYLYMIDFDMDIDKIIDFCLNSNFTRIPIWQKKLDNIIGVIHLRDLFKAIRSHGDAFTKDEFRKILRNPYFVPQNVSLKEQLAEFKNNREHFALVIDEYGTLRGLVTMEDILEEVVGDIEDEHDENKNKFKKTGPEEYLCNGDLSIRDLNRLLDFNLPDDEAVTIAGLVIHEAGIIPEVGQLFSFHGFQFEILEKNKNQISKIKVTKIKKIK